ncbi:hypothetical protein ACQPZF_11410 [Actinosynnema sp. CS-041913]|uniref:hypothetical protein n=1 Tax=Actinosynnema sp. CS-041913 TaxID=3239917 RepID=UPI003D8C70F8
MAPPDKQAVQVATGALRTEAGTWESMSDEIGKAAAEAESLRMTRLEAGIFQLIVGPYEQAVDQIVGRANEGRAQLAAIGSTLRQIADTYDAEEAANEHKIRNVY